MNEKLIAILREEKNYISGEELSRRLGISRTAVWKSINVLREYGYHITSSTNKGYRLEEDNDLLDSTAIRNNLNAKIIGSKIMVLKTVDSTNEEVKRQAAKGAENGLVVAAECQTQGKGRLGRNWSSGTGGLFFSVLLRPDIPPTDVASVTLAAGLGVCLAVREYTGLDARIKWPNDVIVGRKKLCGILTEMAAQTDRIDYVDIGIGINVNIEEFPEEITEKATSLLLETGKKIDRSDFLRCVLQKLDKVINSFLVSLSVEDMQMFSELCATLGRQVAFTRNGIVTEGTAVSVTAAGELVIRCPDGRECMVNSGEVTVQGIY